MVKVKKGKKEWYTILAPEYLGNKEIGKTLSFDAENLIGRKLTISAIDVLNDMSKHYLKFTFRISDVKEKIARTEFNGLECLRDYITRMVFRRVTRVDVVQDVLLKDGKKIRVKSLIVLPKKPSESVKKSIRKKVFEVVESFKNLNLADFVNKVLSEELKKRIYKEIKKIYPVRSFEIRKVEVLY